MPGDVKAHLRQYVIDTFLFGVGGEDLTDDLSLLGAGIIDSTGVLELVSVIEDTYGVQVDDSELVPENFDSLAKIATFVERKRAAAGGGAPHG